MSDCVSKQKKTKDFKCENDIKKTDEIHLTFEYF